MDVSNASTAENAKVIQYTFSNGFNQQFLIKAEVITHTTKEADIDENLFYSPNPFSESCNVKTKTPASYTITDQSGKLIEEGTIEKEQHVGGMLPPGVYTMVIKSGDSGNTRFIKLVKQ